MKIEKSKTSGIIPYRNKILNSETSVLTIALSSKSYREFFKKMGIRYGKPIIQ